MGIEHFRVGKAGAGPFHHGSKHTKRDDTTADASCATGAFYESPALGSSVDSMEPLKIVWKPSLHCLQPIPSLVDIYLENPGSSTPHVHLWEGVPYSQGNYTVNLMPRWWGAPDSANLQILVVPNGTPAFLSTIPAGPVFEAKYSSNGTTPVAADTSVASSNSDATTVVTVTNISGVSSHSMSPGKKAAAVLLPLLFVILLGLAYVKISRARGAAKRSEWSEKLDKRMSTISADWKSITGAGAKEAVRQSMAQRNSSAFSFGSVRTPNVEGDPVIMGEKPLPISRGSIDINEQDQPRTSLGTGVGVRRPRNASNASPPDRTSRAVSFAETAHPRPSVSSIYSRTSRAFHVGSTYGDIEGSEAPPVPALPSPSRISAYGGEATPRKSTSSNNANRVASIYTHHTGGAWSSGERVEGVDGGYGARSVSPTGRVHTINYPSAASLSMASPDKTNFAYGEQDGAGSYFSPVTPTPTANAFSTIYAEDPSADSAYGATTFDAPPEMTSPKQTAGPLTLTPEDIRRRMASNNAGEGAWRQSVDEVFGALSMMRTGGPTSPDAEDESGEYLFAPAPETVFAYPGTPAASSFNSTAPIATLSSPFAMPMHSATMSSSPDAMLRAYAAKQQAGNTISVLSNSTGGAEVVSSMHNTGMRVLYAQPEGQAAQPTPLRKSTLIRAGKGARLSK